MIFSQVILVNCYYHCDNRAYKIDSINLGCFGWWSCTWFKSYSSYRDLSGPQPISWRLRDTGNAYFNLHQEIDFSGYYCKTLALFLFSVFWRFPELHCEGYK